METFISNAIQQPEKLLLTGGPLWVSGYLGQRSCLERLPTPALEKIPAPLLRSTNPLGLSLCPQ